MNEYEQSLKIRRDNYSTLKSAKEEAIAEGIEIERTKAEKEKKEMALKLKKNNVVIELIADATDFTAEEIKALR